MPDRPALLAATDVVRRYPGAQGVVAVRGASMTVRPHDFVAFMGPSGSGKTTFLGVLSGLVVLTLPETKGIDLRDRSVGAHGRRKSLRAVG